MRNVELLVINKKKPILVKLYIKCGILGKEVNAFGIDLYVFRSYVPVVFHCLKLWLIPIEE